MLRWRSSLHPAKQRTGSSFRGDPLSSGCIYPRLPRSTSHPPPDLHLLASLHFSLSSRYPSVYLGSDPYRASGWYLQGPGWNFALPSYRWRQGNLRARPGQPRIDSRNPFWGHSPFCILGEYNRVRHEWSRCSYKSWEQSRGSICSEREDFSGSSKLYQETGHFHPNPALPCDLVFR